MTRSYSPDDVIGLPRMNAATAVALGEALDTAAREHGVPKVAKRAHERLVASRADLAAALAVSASAQKETNPEAVSVDRVVDDGWAGFYGWLGGWVRLGGVAQSTQAAEVLATLFPQGLGFTQRLYLEQWGECAVRLERITPELERTIRGLGGEVFLKELRARHTRYGEVLNVTTAAAQPADATSVRASYEAFLGALRGYVLKVASHEDEDAPETAKQVAALLRPVTELRVRARAKAEVPENPSADKPAI